MVSVRFSPHGFPLDWLSAGDWLSASEVIYENAHEWRSSVKYFKYPRPVVRVRPFPRLRRVPSLCLLPISTSSKRPEHKRESERVRKNNTHTHTNPKRKPVKETLSKTLHARQSGYGRYEELELWHVTPPCTSLRPMNSRCWCGFSFHLPTKGCLQVATTIEPTMGCRA